METPGQVPAIGPTIYVTNGVRVRIEFVIVNRYVDCIYFDRGAGMSSVSNVQGYGFVSAPLHAAPAAFFAWVGLPQRKRERERGGGERERERKREPPCSGGAAGAADHGGDGRRRALVPQHPLHAQCGAERPGRPLRRHPVRAHPRCMHALNIT
jgi:hypothetical protein